MKAETILAQALGDMKSRQGVTLADLRPDEIVALVEACAKVANPFDEVNADLAGFPVRVRDGVYLWRLTVGASIWLDEVQKMLHGDTSDERYRLALIYACANARNPERFLSLTDLGKVEKAVRDCLRRFGATAEEFNAALDRLFVTKATKPRNEAEADPAAADWARLCARLETQTGIPSSEWVWKRTGAYMVKCYHDLNEFARAHSAATGGCFEHMRDDLDDAVNALQILKVRIMRRVKKNDR